MVRGWRLRASRTTDDGGGDGVHQVVWLGDGVVDRVGDAPEGRPGGSRGGRGRVEAVPRSPPEAVPRRARADEGLVDGGEGVGVGSVEFRRGGGGGAAPGVVGGMSVAGVVIRRGGGGGGRRGPRVAALPLPLVVVRGVRGERSRSASSAGLPGRRRRGASRVELAGVALARRGGANDRVARVVVAARERHPGAAPGRPAHGLRPAGGAELRRGRDGGDVGLARDRARGRARHGGGPRLATHRGERARNAKNNRPERRAGRRRGGG